MLFGVFVKIVKFCIANVAKFLTTDRACDLLIL